MRKGNLSITAKILIAGAGLLLLGMVVFTIWRIQLAGEIRRQIAAIRAAGLPTNGTEENEYYAAVPDDQNAALKMAEAFALLENYHDRRSNEVYTIKLPPRRGNPTPEQFKWMAGYCVLNANALARAVEAIKLPHCRYSLDLSCGFDTLLPHLAKLKKLSEIAAFRTIIQTNRAVADISTIIGMARTLDEEPILISKLTRAAMLNMAQASLERRLNLGSLSDVEMKQLGESFAAAAKTNQMQTALIGDRAMCLPYFQKNVAETQTFVKKAANLVGENEVSERPLSDSWVSIFKLTGLFEWDMHFFLQAMSTNIAMAGVFPKNVADLTKQEDQMHQECIKNYHVFSKLFLPAFRGVNISDGRSLAKIWIAQTALAVERFRLANARLPKQLDELVPRFLPAVPKDPFDGQPLRYLLLRRGYVIYSIDQDGEDNGGLERPAEVKWSDKTPYDITFTVER